jgi:hypothetical protein
MSGVSLTSQVYSCAHPKINGENAARAQSARTFDPSLNVVGNIIKDANDPYSGRPSSHNAANGTNGLNNLGYAGMNPTSWMALETGLRQVEFQSQMPNTKFYDTIQGANRAAWTSQRAGSGGACAVYNGPAAYTSTPYSSNQGGQTLTSVDQQNYLKALYNQYRETGGGY